MYRSPTLSPDLYNQPLRLLIHQSSKLLVEVKGGKSLNHVMPRYLPDFEVSSRAGTQDLLYTALRHYSATLYILQKWLKLMPRDEAVALLQVALALLITKKYAPHVAVGQAVYAADTRLKGMVNALLRRYQREEAEVQQEIAANAALTYNLPPWWLAQLQQQHPHHWETVATAQQQLPPLVLRINRRRGEVDGYLEQLANRGVTARAIPNTVGLNAVEVMTPRPVHQLPGFEEGWFSVQDLAAQWATPLLEVADGMTVLDGCAAPGGKTGHILENHDVRLCAIDQDVRRLALVGQNLARLGLQAHIKVGDATALGEDSFKAFFGDAPALFDRVLADVPCTASGVVRRNPDIPILKRPEDIANTAAYSKEVLDGLWRWVKPGGMMLFTNCSLWWEEGEGQLQSFIERHQVKRYRLVAQLLPGVDSPAFSDGDGFFYAQLWKD